MQIQIQMQIVNCILKREHYLIPHRQQLNRIWRIALEKKVMRILFRVFPGVLLPVKCRANFRIPKLFLLGTKMEYLIEPKSITYSTLFISMHQQLCLISIMFVPTIWMNMSKMKKICFLLPNCKMGLLLEGSVKMDLRHPLKIYLKIYVSFLVSILMALITN